MGTLDAAHAHTHTHTHVQVKLVLKRNRFFVETSDAAVFELLKADPIIAAARAGDEGGSAPWGDTGRMLGWSPTLSDPEVPRC